MSKNELELHKYFRLYLEGEKLPKFETASGILIKELYRPDDIKDFDYEKKLGDSGDYPMTRGIYETMYRGRMWTRRFQLGFGTPRETNRRMKFLLKEGATGFTWTIDEPTIHGFDADSHVAEGCVGITGTSISTFEDMDLTFEGLPSNKVSVTLSTGSIVFPIMQAMYMAVAEKRNIPSHEMIGTIQVEPFFLMGGTQVSLGTGKWLPLEVAMRCCIDNIEFITKKSPRFNYIICNTYNVRESGVNAIWEGAVGLATSFCIFDRLLEKGLNIDQFAPRAAFFSCLTMDLFEEVAKFRALRRIWARTLKERYKAKNPRSLRLRIAAQTGGHTYTTQQPLINIIRGTIETMAGILAGVQSIMVSSYDEGICLPTEESSRISLRIQQILGYEAGVTLTIDPLAGSYYIEWLTDKMEEEMLKVVDIIEEKGGMLEAIKSGWFESECNSQRIKKWQEIINNERILVGVNRFTIPSEVDVRITIHRPKSEWEEERRKYLKMFKSKRDNYKVKEALDKLYKKVDSEENLLPTIIEAVKLNATLQEIMDTIREASGFKVEY